MGRQIFSYETGSTEKTLVVNDDGTLTFFTENAGYRMVRRGMEKSDEMMTPEEAKKRWPQYADSIDKALKELSSEP